MKINLFVKIGFSALLMGALSFFLPIVHINNSDAILASATFLYGVLYGFEISIVLSNFSQLKNLVAAENAGLQAIYHLANSINPAIGQNIKTRIEKYLLRAIDVPLTDHLLQTDKEFFAIFEPLNKVRVKTDQSNAALNYINEGLYYLPQSRQQIAAVAPRDVDPPEWFMMLVLAIILIISLLLGREVDVASKISAALFTTTVIGTLLLLDEVDSNRIQEERLEFEVYNDSLVMMGFQRYYPDFAIREGLVRPNKQQPYRIGMFPKYPSITQRKIKLVKAAS